MANILAGLLGQQRIPEFSNPTFSDVISQIRGQLADSTALELDYNHRMAAPLVQIQREAENAYDPLQGALREATTSSILNDLNLGGGLPPDVMASILQSGYERGAASGLGGSGSGRSLVARDLGLTSLDLLRNRQDRAASYSRSAPSLDQLYTPTQEFTPGAIAGFNTNRNNAQNAYQQLVASLKSTNDFNAINTPIQIGSQAAGTAVGAAFGTNSMGGVLQGMNMGGAGSTPALAGYAPAVQGTQAGGALAFLR